ERRNPKEEITAAGMSGKDAGNREMRKRRKGKTARGERGDVNREREDAQGKKEDAYGRRKNLYGKREDSRRDGAVYPGPAGSGKMLRKDSARNRIRRGEQYSCLGSGCLYADGYLTVFLALSIPVLLSLVLTLVEGARMNAIRMKTEIAGNVAARSVLGEFHRELLTQYDLYFVDASFGTGTASVENVQQHLRSYMEKNLSTEVSSVFGTNGDFTGTRLTELTVNQTRFAADDGARALREQVYAYMSADPAGSILAPVLTDADSWRGLLDDGAVWEKQRKEAEENLQKEIREAKKKAKEDFTEEEREDAEESGDNAAEEAIEEMNRFRLLPILRQVFGDLSGVSTASSGGDLLSSRGIHYGDALQPENTHGYPGADEILFDLYLGEKCGCYTKPLEKGKLAYQLEYILSGKETDRENLEKTAEKLLLVREAANCAYLFTDTVRMKKAEALAALVSLVLLCPELKEAFKIALLFAWAYLESIQDLRTLFDGGRVPLWKSPDTWQTPLLGIAAPEAAIRGGRKGSGLLYTDYLQAFLFLEGSSVKSLRTMEVMEMDIRKTPGNSQFRMDWCLDAFSMTAAVSSRFGYEYTLTKTEGYN
ncbi:MAG: DUF5702 domain-containing protein, partial [Eubacteriales bacterium]|nr:DUF5702 domain-containing protein [Eubacteriales bacterium]